MAKEVSLKTRQDFDLGFVSQNCSFKKSSSSQQAPRHELYIALPTKYTLATFTMAKDKTEADIAAKKEKKEKKRKAEEIEDVETTTAKKEKKSKKEKRKSEVAAPDDSVMDVDGQDVVKVKPAEEKDDNKALTVIPIAALVPFANPLASEKDQKKVLKSVKKGTSTSFSFCPSATPTFFPPPPRSHHAPITTDVEETALTTSVPRVAAAKSKAIKRGVKECVKSIRKSPPATPATLGAAHLPPGIVILAADISPMDVISHIPVLCEDHNIPYIYVPSRAELGAAGSTKRPTSVVMLTPQVGKGGGDADEWAEAYKELHKLAVKLGQQVKV
jgi:H/ACA ribonucleoprotein complex subunit 2